MNFDDALRHYWPTAWFHLKFFKYKYRGRGERELALIRHLIAPGSTALDIGSSIGMYAAEMARYADKVIAFEANPPSGSVHCGSCATQC
jgi:predicted RNA methylase